MKTRMCDYCRYDSLYRVTYFQDGSGSKLACGRHITKATRDISSDGTVPQYATLRLIAQVARP